jgi:DNA-binding MarR family transcriptional regulator
MAASHDQAGYVALAEFRYRIRLFLNASERAARAAGIEPEQFQLLLAVRGAPQGQAATIRTLAERLQVRHHTAVERVDRLARLRLVRRRRDTDDRRAVWVELTPRGARLFESLGRQRLRELRESGPALVRALARAIALVETGAQQDGGKQKVQRGAKWGMRRSP